MAEGERGFREMIDAPPAALYTTDAAGRITHFNAAACRTLRPDAQVIGHADPNQCWLEGAFAMHLPALTSGR